MNRSFRRVVTGEDSDRNSFVLKDSVIQVNEIRAICWFTERTADALRDPPAHELTRLPLSPPPGATTFQIIVVPPNRPEVGPRELEAYYENAFAGVPPARRDTDRHPGMHRTATIDYIVMLSGEVTLILSKQEVTLTPFDTLVQRGVTHAWENRGTDPAVFAVTTVDIATAGLAPPESRHALELGALYGLTPAEAEVALAIASGARLGEIAARRGVSLNTVRTLSARLRSKLNAHSQADVVRAVTMHLGALAELRSAAE